MTDTDIIRRSLDTPVALGCPFRIVPDRGGYSIVIDDGRGWLRLAIGFIDRDDAQAWLESGSSWVKTEREVRYQLKTLRRTSRFGYYVKLDCQPA